MKEQADIKNCLAHINLHILHRPGFCRGEPFCLSVARVRAFYSRTWGRRRSRSARCRTGGTGRCGCGSQTRRWPR